MTSNSPGQSFFGFLLIYCILFFWVTVLDITSKVLNQVVWNLNYSDTMVVKKFLKHLFFSFIYLFYFCSFITQCGLGRWNNWLFLRSTNSVQLISIPYLTQFKSISGHYTISTPSSLDKTKLSIFFCHLIHSVVYPMRYSVFCMLTDCRNLSLLMTTLAISILVHVCSLQLFGFVYYGAYTEQCPIYVRFLPFEMFFLNTLSELVKFVNLTNHT